ncbi:hypothetical protein SRABI26_01471 [Arthrobacter sp. Bi26]|uniref:hypothetical protein n=1 Tax=Arthrobacter sp. Bi26 TaxID=2822350 RepID=UPI001DA98E0A|nr:hypothetical protein [Arthrobacter sp. Bi26]CAH0182634.1 hypothetical protein SRABI26_01471 [Arthrobacter sp. Bi26]
MDGNEGPEVVPTGHGDSLISLAGRVRAADLSNLGAVIADVTRIFDAFRPAADCAEILDQIRELEDVESALADLKARIAVDARQRRGQAGGNLGIQGFVAVEAGAATDATAAPMPGGCPSVRPGSPIIVTPLRET